MTAHLPAPLVHRFTPESEPQTLDVVTPVLERLEAMPTDTPDALEKYLEAWNEFDSWIGDHFSQTQVASSRFTKDDEAQTRWAELLSGVLPEISLADDRLAKKFLASPAVAELEDGPYASFIRQTRENVELFREENVPLQKEVQQLCNEYQQISGSWSVEFDGEARTMSAMYGYLADSDREVRKAAYFAIAEEVARTSDELEDLFEKMFALRHQIALNAGFDNFQQYIFRAKHRDYSPEACHNFAEVVKRQVVPLVGELAERDAARMGIESYAPWDRLADADGGKPLEPFKDTEQLKDGVERMMRRLDPELGAQFAGIRPYMDLDARDGKAQGGFMAWFGWERRPFIFSNAAGKHEDIVTLIHEAGHAFHSLATTTAGSKPMAGTSTPMEFNEVASMAMELLHYDTLDEFYDETDAQRAIQRHLRRVVGMFPRTMAGDQFQHWLYTHPEHTREERRAKWVELHREFSPELDMSEVSQTLQENSYHRILHFFIVPFYFVEYAFAQFGSLQVAMRAEKDAAAALQAYKDALALGPQRDVRGLYNAAGVDFDPTDDTLGAAMDWVRERLD